MAEALAIELVSVVAQKMTDKAFKEIARAQGIHNELKELKKTLSRIQLLLVHASEMEATHEAVKEWLNGLQHLAYDIDDVLDDVATEAMKRELTGEPGASTSMVRKLIPITCCTNISLSHRLSPKLDDITSQLQDLENRKSDLGLIKKDEMPKITSRREETSLLEPDVVGRIVEKEILLKKLLGDDDSSKENFSILPIVGMGGVGKTTLARLLYNDTKVQGHFELKGWVCVSDDFDIVKISKTILRDVSTEDITSLENLNQVQMALIKQLKDKRFLLVLDDVWHENYDDWENLMRPFHSGAHGSRIIMTTRKDQLLKKIGFNNLDSLESLSQADALSLFAIHALGVDNFESHPTLKQRGEDFVKKCGCLPLAIRAIGRLLRTKKIGEEWDNVLKSEMWNVENDNGKENSNTIIPALRLSYHDLHADLKQLFAYCSLFPKDFVFDKEELVLLWIAEGFLKPTNATTSPERLGQEYFEILLSRSFFQRAPNEESLFMMHDLMNDLATFVAREFYLRFDNHTEIGAEDLAKCRHMSFNREEYVGHHKFEAFRNAKSMRTLLAVSVGVLQDWNRSYLSNKILVDLLPELTLLRVISLRNFYISELPESIGSLKHLRYLNLSHTDIRELPENVGNLYNLQTLIVFGCSKLIKLPKSISKLKKLRHFDIRDTPLLEKLPLGVSELKNLYTLTKIIIEGEDGFTTAGLKGFKNLHGIISIEGLQRVQNVMHAREAKLSLKEISNLELKWVDVLDGSRRGQLEEEVLNELEPNRDRLKDLSIVSYGGTTFSNWVGDPSFHALVNVSISGCRKCVSLPPFEKLHSLKELSIEGMYEIEVIGLETAGSVVDAFPSLEVLRFKYMHGWNEWSTKNKGFEKVFPCLRELEVVNCPDLINVSLELLPSLRVLKISKCGDSVLRSLVQAASSVTETEIKYISGLTDEVWRGVIEGLRTVEELTIEECDEIRYLWESEAEASKNLVNLKNLEVKNCSNLLRLGEKEEEDDFGSSLLSSLRELYVLNCSSMERCCCPNSISIEDLSIRYCSSLTSVSFPTTAQGAGQKLKSLKIIECENLMEAINNTSLSMLETIAINRWINLKSIIQLSNSIQLTSLVIYNCPGIKSFPGLQLSNLTRLSISNCESLVSFHDLQLSNLTSLEISICESLESLPELSNLKSLTDLEISQCPSIDGSFPCGIWPQKLCSLRIGGLKKPILEWGDQKFPTSLVHLRLSHEPDVRNFSQLANLLPSSLTSLLIKEFDNLESLSTGLQHLTSLQHLCISNCPKMIQLPETLLPSLLRLFINGCPVLKERCNGRGSHYWPLISHIPCFNI